MDFGRDLDQFRQASGAIVFPPTPQQAQLKETQKELEEELAEVRKLKLEMQEFLNSNKQKSD